MRRSRGETGDTLVEVLLALVIVGVAGVAILGGLGSGIFSSALHREQTVAGTILESSGEALENDAANPYVNCATTSSYAPEGGFTTEAPPGWTVSITSVTWWYGNTLGFVPTTYGSCPDTSTDNILHLQQITLQVASPSGRTVQSRSFLKLGP